MNRLNLYKGIAPSLELRYYLEIIPTLYLHAYYYIQKDCSQLGFLAKRGSRYPEKCKISIIFSKSFALEKGKNFRLNLFHEKKVKFSRNKTCENFVGWIWVNVGGQKE